MRGSILAVLGILTGLIVGVAPDHALATTNNSDAAHACQQGGYANLTGVTSSGKYITFTNVGDCVSYAAHGGIFVTPLPTCTVDATHGCMTFDGANLVSYNGTGLTITLSGAISFDSSCPLSGPWPSHCPYYQTPNAYASGGGIYIIRDGSGGIFSQGRFLLADTPGTQEGLEFVEFRAAAGIPVTSCSAATLEDTAVVNATFTDDGGNPSFGSQTLGLQVYNNYLDQARFAEAGDVGPNTGPTFHDLLVGNFSLASTQANLTC